jgi:hypothetical protein
LIDLPFCSRPLALSILVALYRYKKTDAKEGRHHKTPVELMCGLLALLLRWFPERKWEFAGDDGYGTHEFARFAFRHHERLTLVSKFILVSKFMKDANLYHQPPKRKSSTNGPLAKKASQWTNQKRW